MADSEYHDGDASRTTEDIESRLLALGGLRRQAVCSRALYAALDDPKHTELRAQYRRGHGAPVEWAATILAEVVYRQPQGSIAPGWAVLGREQIYREVGVHPDRQPRARKLLVALGWLEKKRVGVPPRWAFQLVYESLIEHIVPELEAAEIELGISHASEPVAQTSPQNGALKTPSEGGFEDPLRVEYQSPPPSGSSISDVTADFSSYETTSSPDARTRAEDGQDGSDEKNNKLTAQAKRMADLVASADHSAIKHDAGAWEWADRWKPEEMLGLNVDNLAAIAHIIGEVRRDDLEELARRVAEMPGYRRPRRGPVERARLRYLYRAVVDEGLLDGDTPRRNGGSNYKSARKPGKTSQDIADEAERRGITEKEILTERHGIMWG